jgi:hypothetical protein
MFHREINSFPWPFLDSYVNLAEGKPYENMIKKMALFVMDQPTPGKSLRNRSAGTSQSSN